MRKKTTKIKASLFLTVLTAAIFIFIGNINVGFGQVTQDFNTISGTGGNDNLWSGSIATTAESNNWNGWTLLKAYRASNCLKLGSTSTKGTAQSPAFGAAGNAILTFRAGAWDGSSEKTTLKISISGGGILSVTSVTMLKASFSNFSINITGATALTKIKFEGQDPDNSRYFLDDVNVIISPACSAPTTQATTAAFSTITNNSMNLSWTSGNGNSRIVVMKEASAVSGTPTSGTAYTANAAFDSGSGSTIATGEYVVYNGTGSSVSVSNLKCGTTYHVKVFEYNTTGVCYNTTSPASTSASTLITSSPSVPSFTQICGSTTYGSISNTATESTFWQTNSTGIIETDPANVTKTVNTSTTLYLRTKSTTGCWSNATTVSPSIISSPSITTQPVDQNGTDGGSVTFSVIANNTTGYQWQVSTNGGTDWNNVSGATSASLSVASLTLAMNGYKYRVNVKATSPCTDVISNVGTLSVVSGPCFEELFTGLTGDNTTNTGSATQWTGNTNFITLSTVFQAGNAIKLGSGSNTGSITSSALPSVSGDVTVTIKVKGWTSVEGNLKITLNGVEVTRTYTATLSNPFETISASFTGVPSNSTLIIETTAKRAFIDDIQILCAPSSPTLIATPISLSALNYTVGSGPSTAQTFNLTGSNLDGTDVSLTLTNSNFEISKDNSTWSTSSLNFTAYSGTSSTIYVRLKTGLATSTYAGNITISGGGVAAINQPSVAISGQVSAVVAPSISSSSTQAVVYGSATSYQIVASQSPTSYSATGLPAGLSINTTTGLISGTPTVGVNSYTSTINAINAGGTGTLTLTWNITPKPLTISGLSIANKVYDGNVTASLSGSATLTGVVGSDNVLLSGTASANFANKNIGTAKTVSISGYSLGGTNAGNYSLTQPAGLTANITVKSLTLTGVSANNKVYDGNTSASFSGGTLSGIISPDVVTFSGGGTFASSNSGTGISVTSSLSLTGVDGGNYTLTQPTGLTANITKANPVFTTTAIALNVSGTYVLPGANVSSTSPEAITYSISSGGNATLAGTTISGVTVGTETLTVTQAESTNYNAGNTTVTVNVNDVANGTYRTTSAGTWPSSGTATWERYSGGSWSSATPTASSTDLLIIRHTVNTSGAFSATGGVGTKMTIENGGTFTDAHASTFSFLRIKGGGTFEANNSSITFLNTATFQIDDNGTVNVNTYVSKLWDGNEVFFRIFKFSN